MSTSTDSPPSPRPPWYRRIKPWQFSVRTLLVLMAIASAVCWYYLLPQRDEEELAGGYLLLKREYRQAVDVVGAPSPDGPGMQLNHTTLNDGFWRLSDLQGNLLVDGRYRHGKEAGWWTTYHANGRKAVQGKMKNGQRSGVWRTWSEAGTLVSELSYRAGVVTPEMSWKTTAESISQLHGPAKLFHENGKLAAVGEYHANEREGTWQTWDGQGTLIATGSYAAGKKQGKWRETAAGSTQLRDIEYVHGLRKELLAAHLKSLAARLADGDATARLTLLSVAADVGAPALPVLEPYVRDENPHVQLAAITGVVRCGGDLPSVLTRLKNLAESNDVRIAAAARWLIYREFPGERDEHLAELLREAENSGANHWPAAFDRLREMFVLERRHRPEIFAAVLRNMPDFEVTGYVHHREIRDEQAAAKAIAVWQLHVVPYLEQGLADPDSKVRLAAVRVIRQLLIENGEFTAKQRGPNAISLAWVIPARLAPLVAKAREDDYPEVKKAAEAVDNNPNGGQGFGGGGLF